jgi:hypothetical protein
MRKIVRSGYGEKASLTGRPIQQEGGFNPKMKATVAAVS